MLPFLSEFWKVLLIFSRVSLELGIFVGVVSLRQPHGAGIAADSVATRSALLSRFLCSWNGRGLRFSPNGVNPKHQGEGVSESSSAFVVIVIMLLGV